MKTVYSMNMFGTDLKSPVDCIPTNQPVGLVAHQFFHGGKRSRPDMRVRVIHTRLPFTLFT